eukprot:scaffold150346_cov16-Prasinocladus_malaysianus.AAC.1
MHLVGKLESGKKLSKKQAAKELQVARAAKMQTVKAANNDTTKSVKGKENKKSGKKRNANAEQSAPKKKLKSKPTLKT